MKTIESMTESLMECPECPECASYERELLLCNEKLKNNERKISAMIAWLEQNQPDVFRRGLWDALALANAPLSRPPAEACENCSTPHVEVRHDDECGAQD